MIVERTDFVSVPVTDVERSKVFYRDALGLELTDDGDWPEFRLGENAFLYLMDPTNIGQIEVPAADADPQFLGNLIASIKARLNQMSEDQQKEAEAARLRAQEWAEGLATCTKPDDFTAMVSLAKSRQEKESLIAAAASAGCVYDKGAAAFVAKAS